MWRDQESLKSAYGESIERQHVFINCHQVFVMPEVTSNIAVPEPVAVDY